MIKGTGEDSKGQRKASRGRADSVEGGLGELKERGKKALKKLIPTQSIVVLRNLVRRGADNLRREIMPNQRLLPPLTLTHLQPELTNPPPELPAHSFQEVNSQLTHSMLFFHQTLHGPAEDAEILRLQTQKCYRRIPQPYFEPVLGGAWLGRLLSRERGRAVEAGYELGDYLDEVEFNVNQQVAYKMQVFMTFVSYLTSIGNLADLSLSKMRGARLKNNVVREIVVLRAARVNALRQSQAELEQSLSALQNLKKMKKLENLLISQLQAKGKIAVSTLYSEYCALHDTLKPYCCPRQVCKFWDVAYYVERGYQESFTRSLKNYLTEIAILDHKQLQDVVRPNRQVFATLAARPGGLMERSIDESYEIEEEVELITKQNIEREIVSIFQQGLHKCTYATDEICQELKAALVNAENQLYALLQGDNTPLLVTHQIPPNKRRAALDALPLPKYLAVIELWSERLKKVVHREVSVVERALKAASGLKREFPEKEEVISSYLMQIIEVTLLTADESLAEMVSSRKVKPQETDTLRQMLAFGKQWRALLLGLKTYPNLWLQLTTRYTQPKLVESLMGRLAAYRCKQVEQMVNTYTATSMENLPVKLQEDDWKAVTFPSRFEKTLGEVLYSSAYTHYLENSERKLLSSSLLLDRSMMLEKGASLRESAAKLEEGQPTPSKEVAFDLHVSEKVVRVEGEGFRLVNSTLAVVEWLHGYLEWVEEAGQGQPLENTILSKIMEFLLMYNTHVRQLILQKQALRYGRIRSKAITGKHLLTAYAQLKFFRTLSTTLAHTLPAFSDFSPILSARLTQHMAELSLKFRTILELSLRESINRMVVDPRKEIKGPLAETQQIVAAVGKSCEYVREALVGEGELGQFIGVQWCAAFLEKLATLYKSVERALMNSGSRRPRDIDWNDNLYWKLKELEYVVQSLNEVGQHLPGWATVAQELEKERRKLDHPH